MSYSLQPHGLQHTKLSCPWLSPGACSNSCPLSWWCHPTMLSSVIHFSSCLQFSQHQHLFPWIGSSQQVVKELEPHFSTSPSNEYSGLISFRSDWLALLAVWGTLRSLLQHHSSKASILQHLAFFIQLLHSYMTPEITISLIIWTCVGKGMYLLFNTLSRVVIVFHPRNNHLLILWLQSPSAVILESKKIKSVTTSIFSPIYLPWVMGPDTMIFFF